jgi:hypothetical protein
MQVDDFVATVLDCVTNTRISTRLLPMRTRISLIFTTAISIDAPDIGTDDAF